MTARTASKKLAGPPPTGMFVYTTPNGGTITLPPLSKALDAAELRMLRRATPLEIMYHVLERDNPPGKDGTNPALEAIDAALTGMTLDEDIPALVEAWQDFSKTNVGES